MEDVDIDAELLISLVQERPVLWDKSLEAYKSKKQTTAAWREICNHVNPGFESMSDDAKNKYGRYVIKKWTNVKDSWIKAQRKILEQKSSGLRTKFKKYLYHKELAFLKKNLISKDGVVSFTREQEVDRPQPKASCSAEESRPLRVAAKENKKQKQGYTEQKVIQTSGTSRDRHISFYKGIIPSLVQLNDEETLQFQMGVLEIVQNIRRARSVGSPPHSQPIHVGANNQLTPFNKFDPIRAPSSASFKGSSSQRIPQPSPYVEANSSRQQELNSNPSPSSRCSESDDSSHSFDFTPLSLHSRSARARESNFACARVTTKEKLYPHNELGSHTDVALPSTDDEMNIVLPQSPPSPHGQPPPKLRRPPGRSHTNPDVILSLIEKRLLTARQEDEFDIFGKIVATKLRKLPDQTQIYAEKLITDILFQAQIGSLNTDTLAPFLPKGSHGDE